MTDAATHPKAAARARRPYLTYNYPLLRRVFLTREFAVIGGVAVVAIVASAVIPYFASPLTTSYLLLDATPVLLMVLPMALILISGEIDLSVASTVGLSNVMLGYLYDAGWSIQLAIVAALAFGLLVGAINGFLVTVVGLPSLAVTIGTLALFRGISVGVLGTRSITKFPIDLKLLAIKNFGTTGIPMVMVVVAVFAIGFAILLHFTSFGRGVVIIGRNSEVAQFSGVNVQRTKFVLFLASGFVAALAGVFYTFRYGSSRGDNAEGLELVVIAAALLGGVSIFGGRGAIHGVLAGVLLIGILQSAMRLANLTADVINIVIGVLLAASVVAPTIFAWLRNHIGGDRGKHPAPA